MMILEHGDGTLSEIELDFIQRVYTRSLQIAGTEGSVEWKLRDDRSRIYLEKNGSWEDHVVHDAPHDIGAVVNQTYIDELAHFGEVVRGNEAPCNPLSMGIHVLSVALAAHKSSREKRRIEL